MSERGGDGASEVEGRFRAFMDNSPTTAWIKDERGRCVYISNTIRDQNEISFEQLEGKTDFDLWPLEDAKEFHKIDLEILATGRPYQNIERNINSAR